MRKLTGLEKLAFCLKGWVKDLILVLHWFKEAVIMLKSMELCQFYTHVSKIKVWPWNVLLKSSRLIRSLIRCVYPTTFYVINYSFIVFFLIAPDYICWIPE